MVASDGYANCFPLTAWSISGAKNGIWRIHFLLTVLSKSGQQKLIMISSELEISFTLSVTVAIVESNWRQDNL